MKETAFCYNCKLSALYLSLWLSTVAKQLPQYTLYCCVTRIIHLPFGLNDTKECYKRQTFNISLFNNHSPGNRQFWGRNTDGEIHLGNQLSVWSTAVRKTTVSVCLFVSLKVSVVKVSQSSVVWGCVLLSAFDSTEGHSPGGYRQWWVMNTHWDRSNTSSTCRTLGHKGHWDIKDTASIVDVVWHFSLCMCVFMDQGRSH